MTDAGLLPSLAGDSRFFWEAGRDGALLIQRCRSCGFFSHPPYPRCPRCTSADVGPEPVSGQGTVYSFTVKPGAGAGRDGDDEETVIAVVELDEEPGLRLVTNVTDCEVSAVHIGLRVTVHFVPRDDVWLPLFRPSAR